jgi:hypothetical protein
MQGDADKNRTEDSSQGQGHQQNNGYGNLFDRHSRVAHDDERYLFSHHLSM